jgi:hypothetical protein
LKASQLRRTLIESLILNDNLLFILTSYFGLLKITSIGKGIALKIVSGINIAGGRNSLKNFDQWTKELSKQIVLQSDEQDMKATGKANEFFNDDDFEEEE